VTTKRSPELAALQEAFWLEVVLGGNPDARPLPCWFGENVPGIDSCEGRIEGAHWLKRQRVARTVAAQLDLPIRVTSPTWRRRHPETPEAELVLLAEWDSRNGVPACNKHHTRFDSQRMPPLLIWRHEVPPLVEMFVADWDLEVALADRCPSISAECPLSTGRPH
jgi:hypothetical protein